MTAIRPRRAQAASSLLCVIGAGCIASNVLAPKQRMVVDEVDRLPFVAAPCLPLEGLYESVAVRGDAALSLRKVYYLFAGDGTYTAAALVEAADGQPHFQTLSGRWRTSGDGLSLDEGSPALLEQADDHLRITAPNGVLILRRAVVQ